MKSGSLLVLNVVTSVLAFSSSLAADLRDNAAANRGTRRDDGPSDISLPSPKTSAVGKPFSIRRQDGVAWLVRPNGERFFSLGVCVVNMGASREEYTSHNPGYSA